jgi:hypothetical protein
MNEGSFLDDIRLGKKVVGLKNFCEVCDGLAFFVIFVIA